MHTDTERALASANSVRVNERRLTGNRFLDALPAVAADAVANAADLVVIGLNARLASAGDPIGRVLFPVSGAVAHLIEHDDGHAADLYTVGHEGVVGHEVLLGEPRAVFARVTSVPVCGFSIESDALLALARDSAELRALAGRYAVATARLAGIGAACERHHQVAARLARWLLDLYDHAGSAPMTITHERAALSLDVRRASVTRAYADVAATGAIRVVRGKVAVLEPGILEELACGCRRLAQETVNVVYADAPVPER